ncbi:MAG: ATP-binding protein [Pseudomonadota bacterium]
MVIRRPIRIKIFAISLLPVIALILVAIINFRLLNSLGQSAERIMSRNYASIKAAQQARQVLEENRNLVLAYIFKKDPGILKKLEVEAFSEALAVCRQHIAEIGEKHIVDTLTDNYQHYQRIIDHLSLIDSTVPTQEFMNLTASTIAEINTLVDLNERGMEAAEHETHQLAIRAQRHSLFFLCATIGLIILLIYWLSHRVAKPIRLLAQSLADSHQGRDCYPNLPVQSNDEIGLLTEQFNSLFKRLYEYDTHNTAILAAERLKVRAAEEAKGRFIADLSHQLKTPMTSLAMSINLLNEKRQRFSEERVAVLLETAKEDCDRMINLINELVDIARLESIIRPSVREKLDVLNLVRNCLKPLEEIAETKGISLTFDIEADLPPITLDSRRFPWVFTNLVDNALRYTEPGGQIIIRVERRQGRFYFNCSDTGCGIEPQYLPHIFDRYTQFSEREKLGTIGLGLAIVKEIIEQYGGEIIVESHPGQGTSFTFWIPEQLEALDAKSTAD